MIERFLKNDLSKKRWEKFISRKTAWYSTIILIGLVIVTFTAPLVSNSKPLYMNYKGKSYFPVLVDYHPKEYGILDTLVVNYKGFKFSETDTVIWPMFRWDPFESNKSVDHYPSGPTADNILGTDESGRDVFARILYGFKYSIIFAFLVWVFSLVAGIVIGGIQGFLGGKVDLIGQRMVEIFSSTPQFFLLLILISIFTPSLLMLVVISTIFGWIGISQYIRAEFLKNRKREYVEAAKSLGASNSRIIFKHLLPNSLVPVITFAPFVISGNIVSLAMLDYLGFGLPVPTPSWGELLAQAQKHFTVAWWLAVYPSIALFLTLVLMNLIGEGVRDAMDPNMN